MTYATDRIEALLDEGVRDKVYPGAVWAVGDAARVRASGTTGVLDPDEPGAKISPGKPSDTRPLASPADPARARSPEDIAAPNQNTSDPETMRPGRPSGADQPLAQGGQVASTANPMIGSGTQFHSEHFVGTS